MFLLKWQGVKQLRLFQYNMFLFLTILKKDSLTIFVNAIMYYQVKDPLSTVANDDDYNGSARLLAATTLRNILGTRNLGNILSDRESIAQKYR
jgi:regulator of protease activity HflC (stomatin/prohibitin superfamily)